MLIVNADDWGYDLRTTEAIAEAFRAGRVTSTTAMVYMEDSERAATLAKDVEIPVGLHLNLTEPYSGADVPAPVERRLRRVDTAYRRNFAVRWLPSRMLFSDVRCCVDDQRQEFGRLYGEPTHIDGHQHGHLSTAALITLALAGGRTRIRRSFTFRRDEKPVLNRALRGGLNRAIGARFETTQEFHAIRSLHPRLGGRGAEAVIDAARNQDVEIMVHPGRPDEFDLLMSEEWRQLLSAVPLGSYLDVDQVARLADDQ